MTESEWVTDINPGYRTKIIKVKNYTIEINHPILTDEEREKAETRIKQALSCICKG